MFDCLFAYLCDCLIFCFVVCLLVVWLVVCLFVHSLVCLFFVPSILSARASVHSFIYSLMHVCCSRLTRQLIDRYPADVIRGQTTRLGPGFYEPKVHPLNCAVVKDSHKNSMAFLKTGRRSGPPDWTLNYIPKKDPFVERLKDRFAHQGLCDVCDTQEDSCWWCC